MKKQFFSKKKEKNIDNIKNINIINNPPPIELKQIFPQFNNETMLGNFFFF